MTAGCEFPLAPGALSTGNASSLARAVVQSKRDSEGNKEAFDNSCGEQINVHFVRSVTSNVVSEQLRSQKEEVRSKLLQYKHTQEATRQSAAQKFGERFMP